MKLEISDEERMFLEGCVYDSWSEGHFDPNFDSVDTDKCFRSLVARGLIINRFNHPEDYVVTQNDIIPLPVS